MSEWLGWLMPTIKVVLGLGALGVGSLALLLYIFQARILYYPTMPPEAKTMYLPPDQFGLAGKVEEVFFRAEDGVRLQAYVVLHARSTEVPTLLFFHGNAGNLSFRLDNISKLVNIVGVNVVIISYRGYGKSDESEFPSEAGLQKDARAALAYLRGELAPKIDANNIFLFGRSLGGAVATYLAAEKDEEIAGLIVENTFTTIPDMAASLFTKYFAYFERLIHNQWRSVDRIGSVHVPVLFLSGEKDELVPPRMMAALYDKCPSLNKELALFEGGMHMNTYTMPGYWGKIAAFITRHSRH